MSAIPDQHFAPVRSLLAPCYLNQSAETSSIRRNERDCDRDLDFLQPQN